MAIGQIAHVESKGWSTLAQMGRDMVAQSAADRRAKLKMDHENAVYDKTRADKLTDYETLKADKSSALDESRDYAEIQAAEKEEKAIYSASAKRIQKLEDDAVNRHHELQKAAITASGKSLEPRLASLTGTVVEMENALKDISDPKERTRLIGTINQYKTDIYKLATQGRIVPSSNKISSSDAARIKELQTKAALKKEQPVIDMSNIRTEKEIRIEEAKKKNPSVFDQPTAAEEIMPVVSSWWDSIKSRYTKDRERRAKNIGFSKE